MNGCGKSTMMDTIGFKEVPIPDHFDIYHLRGEMPASELSALTVTHDRRRLLCPPSITY